MTDFSDNKKAFLALRKPQAVIFDWDNTLVNTWPLIQQAIDSTMIKMGKEPWGLKRVMDNIHKSMRESFPEIFGDQWEKAGEIYKESYRSMNLKTLEFLPDALKLVDVLRQDGVKVFIISNKIGQTLRKEAESLKVTDKFCALVGAGDAKLDKPSTYPVDLALKDSGLDPKKDEVWFVGDTVTDLECAYNSGCQPIIIGVEQDIVSKTIPQEWIANGKANQGPVPVYFYHQELIDLFNNL